MDGEGRNSRVFVALDHQLDAEIVLYSDNMFLHYIHNMAKFGMTSYTIALSNSARPDIRKLFT
jgi:spore coat protein CotF